MSTMSRLTGWGPDLVDRYEAPEPAPPALAIVPKGSLRSRIEGVDLILEALDQLDGENLTDQRKLELSEDLISALAGTRQKVDNVNSVLSMFGGGKKKGLEASAAKEIERLKARAARYANQRQRLTDYVLATMEASHLPKLDGETSTLALRRNPPSVCIDDMSQIPGEYLRYPVPALTVDKTAIARDLKAHHDVPGARLVQSVRLVRT
jgi:hypothetical protein